MREFHKRPKHIWAATDLRRYVVITNMGHIHSGVAFNRARVIAKAIGNQCIPQWQSTTGGIYGI